MDIWKNTKEICKSRIIRSEVKHCLFFEIQTMEMIKTSQSHQTHIDCAQGLMILHMMLYHLCADTINNTPLHYHLLHPLSFFMAWFFFKSGMFYKEKKLKDTFLDGIRKCIIPYIIFSIIGFLVYYFTEYPTTSISLEWDFFYVFGAFRGNMPLWFLLSLFLVQLLYSLVQKCRIKPIYIAIISLGLLILNKEIGFRPYIMKNVPLGLLFYALGQILKDIQYKRIFIIISLFVYFGLYFIHTDIDFLWGKLVPEYVAIPWALSGCILLNALFKFIPLICVSPLKFLGTHSMEFYCTHIIIIYIIEVIFIKQLSLHTSIGLPYILFEFISFAIYVLLLSSIIRFYKPKHFQWIFGKKATPPTTL